MTTLMQSAVDEWPEAEARATYRQWRNLCTDESIEYADAWLPKQIDHMRNVFYAPGVDGTYDQCQALFQRYKRALEQQFDL